MGLFSSRKKPLSYRASQACQVRMNIRCGKKMSYQTLANIFKKIIPYEKNVHTRYLLGFFEECPPNLIKSFMTEQNISKKDIIDIFMLLPAQRGETFDFRKVLENGEF